MIINSDLKNIIEDNINSRFIKVLEINGYTGYRFSKETNTSESVVTHIRNGRNAPSQKYIEVLLEKFPKISKVWLLTGQGSMYKNSKDLPISYNDIGETGYYLPDVSTSAGLDAELENSELKRIPVTIPGWEKDVIFINVFGDSMYPKYNAGEIIGVKFIEFQYLNYGYPYVIVFNNGDVYIKIVQPGSDKDHLILESINEFYKPKEFHLEQIKSFYSIKGVIKKEMM